MRKLSKNFTINAIFILLVSSALSFLIVLVTSGYSNFFVYFPLVICILIILSILWRISGSRKEIAWMILVAFIVRLCLGLLFSWGLPIYGYEEEVQRAGYVFADAFTRDGYAWDLAQSGNSIFKAFGSEFMADQYGGMLAISALVYRIFTPNQHLPVLMLPVSAGIAAFGIPFIYTIASQKFGHKAGKVAAWTLVLYPEGVLLGASQMREPYLITFFSVLFWGFARLVEKKKDWKTIITLISGMLGLALISFRVMLPIMGVLLVWLAINWRNSHTHVKVQKWVWGVFGLAFIGLIIISLNWLRSAMHWDLLQTYRASGWMQYLFENSPTWVRAPFIVIYGVFQPLLPAAIADPAPWIWKSLGILRGLGWYSLLPIMVYGLIIVWKEENRKRRIWLIWILIAIWGWVLLASLRAGGDQWDNPRYRTIFLPLMVMIISWAVIWAKENKDRWLGRIFLIEGIFLAFFMHWYLSRYYDLFKKIPFWTMLGLIVLLSIGILVGGVIIDKYRLKKTNKEQ